MDDSLEQNRCWQDSQTFHFMTIQKMAMKLDWFEPHQLTAEEEEDNVKQQWLLDSSLSHSLKCFKLIWFIILQTTLQVSHPL